MGNYLNSTHIQCGKLLLTFLNGVAKCNSYFVGLEQYSCIRHFGEIDFFGNFEMADYFARCHMNFILKKHFFWG